MPIKFDVTVFADDLNKMIDHARIVEEYGFDGLWTAETMHNPFLPLTLAATSTQKINLGTQIAIAFPRSPMVSAQIAWDLAKQSGGRFILGLGTQVKTHIVLRFSSRWEKPVPQLRDYIGAMRAIWESFQEESGLRYRGKYYKLGVLPPFFNPGPIEHPDIPVYIAGVGKPLCRLGGEIADGFHVHPFHTAEYLREVTLPAIAEGAETAGRTLDDIERSCAVFVVTGRNQEEMEQSAKDIKTQISFYASTPSYRPVLEQHGWGEIGDRLNQMTREGKWHDMWEEISDEMLEVFAVVAPPDELPYKVRERYSGLLTRLGFYFPFEPDEEARRVIWEHASTAMNQ